DLASQLAVRNYLLGQFPDHRFVGEEDFVGKSIADTRPDADGPPVWVVDPLDGTSNYVHDVPAYCVSIGLWHAGRAVVGVILDPRMGETFTAAAGQGAFLNGEPIRVSETASLRDALLSTGFPGNWQRMQQNLAAWHRLSEHAQGLRRTGSTALNLAYVAAGRFDGYWAFDNWPWDVTAGACLVTEAGGHLTAGGGGPFDPFSHDMIATNGKFHPELHAVLSRDLSGST
ncbi:MAG: inositol monophosphatase family protein, partial [Fimbriiglobus sp.]